MKRILALIAILALVASVVLIAAGCNKEKIVESTKYVHDVEYVTLPPDTVRVIDTLYRYDTTKVNHVDTVRRVDTVRTTVTVHDTVFTVRNHYDTVVVIDTVVKNQYAASAPTAIGAMEYYTDPMVLQLAKDSFNLSDGWVYYLSGNQMYVNKSSANVYDLYGYLDYWATDWSGYYPMEFYWRVTYNGGDPTVPTNWSMTTPPSAVSGHMPGIKKTGQKISIRQLVP